ncbi:hypothetical protein AMV216 [Betaentomopoxvirus amoorei]|uniref:AMV216 n=1 Tax=Amsacta moorei entomopoxvirus TaxID=28321 RepID=Q9EMJ0_AMEPV|nr:hypothetical protein AMV216 [Amsacta moorei entomopoxvirus]AAG02922.1 AMV216 [Amsacta moorei entomopoxvirus]
MFKKTTLFIFIFTIYNIKSQFICDKQSSDVVLQLPDILNCNNIEPIKAKIILRTLNEKSYSTNAILFTNIDFICTEPPSIYLNWAKTEYIIHHNIVEYNDIINVNKTHVFKNKTLIYNEDDNSYKYGKAKHFCVHYTFHYNTVIQEYINLKPGKVYYRKGTMLSNIANTYNCNYYTKYCQVSNSDVLVWDIDNNAKNEYNDSDAIDVDIIINNDNMHIIFNYLNNPISLIVSKSKYELNKNNFINTNEHEFSIKILSILDLHRHKREIYNYGSKIQYISDIIQTEKSQIHEMCEKISSMILRLYSICKVNAYSCISSLLNDKSISVNVVGNLYIVKKCLDVDIIEYKPSYNKYYDFCHELIPVIFSIKNKTFNGYYNTESTEIYYTSRLIKKGKCENEQRFISCNDNTNNQCIYNNILGGIEKINNNIYTITKNNINELLKTIEPNNINPNFGYKPTLKDIINSRITFNDFAEFNHESTIENYNNQSNEILALVVLCIILIFMFVFSLIKILIIILKYMKKNIIKTNKTDLENFPMLSDKI